MNMEYGCIINRNRDRNVLCFANGWKLKTQEFDQFGNYDS